MFTVSRSVIFTSSDDLDTSLLWKSYLFKAQQRIVDIIAYSLHNKNWVSRVLFAMICPHRVDPGADRSERLKDPYQSARSRKNVNLVLLLEMLINSRDRRILRAT